MEKMHNEDLHNLHFLLRIIKVNKSRKMSLPEYMIRIWGEEKLVQRFGGWEKLTKR